MYTYIHITYKAGEIFYSFFASFFLLSYSVWAVLLTAFAPNLLKHLGRKLLSCSQRQEFGQRGNPASDWLPETKDQSGAKLAL